MCRKAPTEILGRTLIILGIVGTVISLNAVLAWYLITNAPDQTCSLENQTLVPMEIECQCLNLTTQQDTSKMTTTTIISTDPITELTTPSTTTALTTTTTPTTTISTASTTTTTTEAPRQALQDGQQYIIVSSTAPMAMSVYMSNLTNQNPIYAEVQEPDCSAHNQVWRLEYHSSTNTYRLASALGSGSQKWTWGIHGGSANIFIWLFKDPHYSDAFWRVEEVPGRYNLWMFVSAHYTGKTISNSGIFNVIGGVNLITRQLDVSDPSQWWELRKCTVRK